MVHRRRAKSPGFDKRSSESGLQAMVARYPISPLPPHCRRLELATHRTGPHDVTFYSRGSTVVSSAPGHMQCEGSAGWYKPLLKWISLLPEHSLVSVDFGFVSDESSLNLLMQQHPVRSTRQIIIRHPRFFDRWRMAQVFEYPCLPLCHKYRPRCAAWQAKSDAPQSRSLAYARWTAAAPRGPRSVCQ